MNMKKMLNSMIFIVNYNIYLYLFDKYIIIYIIIIVRRVTSRDNS